MFGGGSVNTKTKHDLPTFDTDGSTGIYKLNQSFWFILKFHFWSKKMWDGKHRRDC